MKALILGLVVVTGMLASSSARADYLCSFNVQPPYTTALGTSGYVYAWFSTAPHCSGTLDIYYFCTKGATHSYCATTSNCGADYTYTDSGFNALVSRLEQAALSGQVVTPYSCGTYLGIERGEAINFNNL